MQTAHFSEVSVDRDSLKCLAADVIATWFGDLASLEHAVDRGRRSQRAFRVTLPDHSDIASTSAALAHVGKGRDWFGHGGQFWMWSAVLDYDDGMCAAIVAQYDRRAGELEQRLRALQEGGR